MPLYFRTSSYSSFVRNLNAYDFHKKRSAKGVIEFRHKLFKKGQLDTVLSIQRKSNYNKEITRQLNERRELEDEIKRLERKCEIVESFNRNKREEIESIHESNMLINEKISEFQTQFADRIDRFIDKIALFFCYFDKGVIDEINIAISKAKPVPVSQTETDNYSDLAEEDKQKLPRKAFCMFQCFKKFLRSKANQLFLYTDEAANALDSVIGIIDRHASKFEKSKDFDAIKEYFTRYWEFVKSTEIKPTKKPERANIMNKSNVEYFIPLSTNNSMLMPNLELDSMMFDKLSKKNSIQELFNSESVRNNTINFSDNESVVSFGNMINEMFN